MTSGPIRFWIFKLFIKMYMFKVNLILLLTSLVQGLSLEVMRSVIQLSEGHMGMYSAGCPLWPQLNTETK